MSVLDKLARRGFLALTAKAPLAAAVASLPKVGMETMTAEAPKAASISELIYKALAERNPEYTADFIRRIAPHIAEDIGKTPDPLEEMVNSFENSIAEYHNEGITGAAENRIKPYFDKIYGNLLQSGLEKKTAGRIAADAKDHYYHQSGLYDYDSGMPERIRRLKQIEFDPTSAENSLRTATELLREKNLESYPVNKSTDDIINSVYDVLKRTPLEEKTPAALPKPKVPWSTPTYLEYPMSYTTGLGEMDPYQ